MAVQSKDELNSTAYQKARSLHRDLSKFRRSAWPLPDHPTAGPMQSSLHKSATTSVASSTLAEVLEALRKRCPCFRHSTSPRREIFSRTNDYAGKRTFWLCGGKAGTGKSTIPRTIAQKLDGGDLLRASKGRRADRSHERLMFPTTTRALELPSQTSPVSLQLL